MNFDFFILTILKLNICIQLSNGRTSGELTDPIGQIFPDFNKYINKGLVDFKELVFKKSESMSFGLNLYFEDDLNFIIHDNPADKNEYFFEKREFEDLIEK